jgi:antitoxin component HigA of HigAB toxin-antitoxin module
MIENKIFKLKEINSELDFERAQILERKLRLLSKEDASYKPSRLRVRQLIKAYENKHWNGVNEIAEATIKRSDAAEQIAEQERKFTQKRSRLIKAKMAHYELNQSDLAQLLGHSKTYMSELMNGLCPFSLKDLVVINKLFNLPLEQLVPAFVSEKDRLRIAETINKLRKPSIKLNKRTFQIMSVAEK